MTPSSQPHRAELSLAFAQAAQLGEGIQWHAASGRWWWTDIEGSQLHAWTPGAANSLNCKLPDRLGCFAHTRSGQLILGLAKRLCIAQLPDLMAEGTASPALQQLVAVDPSETRTRVNDGRCDRRGFFVFGTMNEAREKRPIGSFYQYSIQHGLRRLALPAVAIANSVCFSPDGKTLYFTDTLTRRILQCDYEAESAQVGNIRLFCEMSEPGAWPDGSVIDAEGCLWNAQWGGAQVCRYDPQGQRMASYGVPVRNPSCPALGGPDGDWLMTTTARQDNSREQLQALPLSGSLFGLRLPGSLALPESLFDDSAA
ncbi:SMP-30/gluconolactonase/LRE family protein [Pelomonas sp. SE-A7]|uniref:SMP-30/gluconolactonase/LRE family protein n=1 Tax=Pelomonas sp. SE-A7 TaxID=3054953 RepID=UPI00259CEF1A|nr:SMP-30/gluconolactonase/LRE family protein [Pelomonas sp. SE-A7]MDM4765276.1 SMP-30/gluconolactonase/LRE family protein [Pelomonas sp. SE-A7]